MEGCDDGGIRVMGGWVKIWWLGFGISIYRREEFSEEKYSKVVE